MTRKLLPFEHELIATLGISKDEYLEFVALYEQPDFNGQPTATGAEWAIAAAILSIIGTITTVVVTLLNQPQIPSFDTQRTTGGGQPQTRDERFSPRFGFNSAQELAAYGDPVNLVYANRGTGTGANANGGVRVTASLLWSAVRSYGSSQFIQMLMMLSGGAITAIDIEKTAFGQTPLRDLITENLWLYFNSGGTGALRRFDELNDNESTDPTAYGSGNDNPYRIQLTADNTRVDGFSQAYSPNTSNTVGIYGVVPLNIDTYLRNSNGDKYEAPLQITASGIDWTTGSSLDIAVNDDLTVTFARTNYLESDNDAWREAKEIRRSLASVFDIASIFKLGTAIFRVVSVSSMPIDDADFVVRLRCIEAGRAPSASYASISAANALNAGEATTAQLNEYNNIRPSVIDLLNQDQRPDITTASQLADAGNIVVESYGESRETTDTDPGEGSGWNSEVYIDEFGEYRTRWYRFNYGFLGYTEVRILSDQERTMLRRYATLEQLVNAPGRADDVFYTKALVRIAKAEYETLSPCHTVDFALRALVFKRINGRQLEYGSGRRGGYPISDNGIKARVSLFKLRYKEVGQSVYVTVPGIFAISRAADNDNFVYIKFSSNTTTASKATHWSFELEPISDPVAETSINDVYFYLDNNGSPVSQSLASYRLQNSEVVTPTIQFTGRSLAAADGSYPPVNNNPTDLNEWDLFNYDADTQLQFSFDSNPEITITAVTEQIAQPFSDYTTATSQLYNKLALFGFNAYSGKTIQDIRSFTIFATQGRSVRRLRTSGTDEQNRSWGTTDYTYYPVTPDGPSSLAPDIFLDTVLDKEDGIGNYAVVNALDLKQLAITKRFCIANNLFMDCVIADPRSWREFWVEVAPYNLLEFARIGGRETLVPAVPYDTNTGQISRTINITALFNQGNILEDSYKEEYIDYGSNAQDIIANIIYTDMPDDAVFAKKKSVEVVLKDTVEVDAIRQTFDISNYVSSYDHAVLFGKLLCNTRRHVRQAIEFKTYPTSDPIYPGAYIYVDIGQNAWDAIRTGVIGKDGTLNTPLASNPADGTYNFRLYRSDKGMVSLNGVTVINGVSSQLTSYEGYLFVLGVEATTRRVFRVTEVSMDEEGETTVRATIYPCTSDGQSLIADFSNSLFTVRS